jgi:hypothetical protein
VVGARRLVCPKRSVKFFSKRTGNFPSISEYVPHVESCSLEYRLQEVPNVLKTSTSHVKSPVLLTTRTPGYVHFVYQTDDADDATAQILFLCACIASLAYVLYKYLTPCVEGDRRSSLPRTPRSGPSGGSGWFPGTYDDYRRRPPPPYTKYPDNPTDSTRAGRGGQDGPGFWSGVGVGSLGTYLLTRQRNQEPQQRRYDWENERFQRTDTVPQGSRASSSFPQQQSWSSSNRASSSNLGSMRRSTGYGGSTVR